MDISAVEWWNRDLETTFGQFLDLSPHPDYCLQSSIKSLTLWNKFQYSKINYSGACCIADIVPVFYVQCDSLPGAESQLLPVELMKSVRVLWYVVNPIHAHEGQWTSEWLLLLKLLLICFSLVSLFWAVGFLLFHALQFGCYFANRSGIYW